MLLFRVGREALMLCLHSVLKVSLNCASQVGERRRSAPINTDHSIPVENASEERNVDSREVSSPNRLYDHSGSVGDS